MAVYLVTWNLNKERTNYSAARAAFLERVGRYDNTNDPALESVRFISTSSTASDVSADLRQALDSNDRVIVTRLRAGEKAGWLAKTVWEWINARL
jgi:hypothetical protein